MLRMPVRAADPGIEEMPVAVTEIGGRGVDAAGVMIQALIEEDDHLFEMHA